MAPASYDRFPLVVVTPGDRKPPVGDAVHVQFSMGVLAHRHIQQKMTASRSGYAEDEGIVAHFPVGRAERGDELGRIRPADADTARFRGPQTVRSGPHPVVGVSEGHATHSLFFREFNRAVHAQACIEDTGAQFSVPLLQDTEGARSFGLGVEIHAFSGTGLPGERREPVDPVGIDPVARGFGEDSRQTFGAFGRESRC